MIPSMAPSVMPPVMVSVASVASVISVVSLLSVVSGLSVMMLHDRCYHVSIASATDNAKSRLGYRLRLQPAFEGTRRYARGHGSLRLFQPPTADAAFAYNRDEVAHGGFWRSAMSFVGCGAGCGVGWEMIDFWLSNYAMQRKRGWGYVWEAHKGRGEPAFMLAECRRQINSPNFSYVRLFVRF